MNEQKFFKCNFCGNFVGLINNAGVSMQCCGEDMEELIANTTDGAAEKHVPKAEGMGRLVHVQIGETIHPSEEGHHIEFIYLHTKNGGQRRAINVGEKPEAMFALINDEAIEAYAYCNLHGLWKANITVVPEAEVAQEHAHDCGCGHDHKHDHSCGCKE